MNKLRIVLIIMAMFSMQQVFAQDADMSADSKPCATIAKACLAGGYVRSETANKKFWKDCMKPIILGQSVSGVTVDASTVKACRSDKIDKMKKELVEFQNVT